MKWWARRYRERAQEIRELAARPEHEIQRNALLRAAAYFDRIAAELDGQQDN
jgi:hypothetical protein